MSLFPYKNFWENLLKIRLSYYFEMKKIMIVGTYPNEEYKVNMLNECIDSIKPLGYDIMLVSHYPIPTEIQNKVEYVLYDKENTLVSKELTPNWTFDTKSFSITKESGGGHILSVTKNIHNGINYAHNLGYEFFMYMECDNLFDKEDLLKIEFLRYSMYSEKKEMIFFNYVNEGNNIYETLIFGGNVIYYKKHNNLPLKEIDLNGECVSLERLVYIEHGKNQDLFYIVPSSSKDFFSKSEINKEFTKFIIELFISNREPYAHLFLMNLYINPKKILIKINDEDVIEYARGVWSYRKVNVGEKLSVKILLDGYEITKNFELTEENKIDYLKKGFMYFRN